MQILSGRIGVVEGSWMVGIIDELRMPVDGISFHPILVDTKTRFKATVPSEAQKRNGRFPLYHSFTHHYNAGRLANLVMFWHLQILGEVQIYAP
jgi:hypothetical protein